VRLSSFAIPPALPMLRRHVTACLVTLVPVASATAQGVPDRPHVIWSIESDDETEMVLPYGAVVDPSTNTVYVADLSAPGIVEISGDSGHVRRLIGRVGDGPGEIRTPQRLAISPNGRLIAVYDIGRRSVDVFDRQWHYLRREAVGGFNFLKGFGISNDTSVVLAGGRAGGGQLVTGVTWIVPNGVFGLPPYPVDDPEMGEEDRLASRLYAGGGPGQFVGQQYVIADALTGDIWTTSPSGSRRIAQGPASGIDALRSIVTRPRNASGPARTYNFGFRQAVMIEPAADGGFVYFSDDSKELVEVYRVKAGGPAQLVASYRLRASILVRYDDDSVIVVDHYIGGWRLSRVRLPHPAS
jgi:hypothetical protein